MFGLSENPQKSESFWQSRFLHLGLIVLVGIIAYSNTFNVPFQWDDQYFIYQNPIIKDLNCFIEPSLARQFNQYESFRRRPVGYFSFGLNYKLHGLNLWGYHLTNLAIHILNGILLYFLVIITFRTPFFSESSHRTDNKSPGNIALFSALLFVSHPMQIEAVTYIFQRFASLAAFFCLLALVLYAKGRLAERRTESYAFLAMSVISSVLAMKTKENAFILPFLILLYEFSFFEGAASKRFFRLISILLTLSIVPLTVINIDSLDANIAGKAIKYLSSSSMDYLRTQFRVVVTYIRLLLVPVGQNVFHDYPASGSFFDFPVLISFIFLVSIFLSGIYLFRASKKGDLRRLAAFGIFWFFIALSVESSIIPLPMVINEYRAYLPSAGFFMAFTAGAYILMNKLFKKRHPVIFTAFFIMAVAVFTGMTYSRNIVWGSWMSLWEDVAAKSPNLAKGHYNLGNEYLSKGLIDKAIVQYADAIRIEPGYAAVYNNLGNAYMNKGMTDKALENYTIALMKMPDNPQVHYNLGRAYISKGMQDKALGYFHRSLELNRDYEPVHYEIAVLYWNKEMRDEAIRHFKRAIELNPYSADTHYMLGSIYLKMGLKEKALPELEKAVKLNPDNQEARKTLDRLYEISR